MAESNLFMAENDELDLVDIVLSNGCALVPSIHWETDEYEEIRSVDRFLSLRKATNLYFITSPGYQESALVMRPLTDNPGSKYYIVQREGGPSIDWLCLLPYTEGNVTILGASMLAYYDNYWSVKQSRMVTVPQKLKALFRHLISELRSHGEIRKAKAKSYIVCKHAMAEISQGTRLCID